MLDLYRTQWEVARDWPGGWRGLFRRAVSTIAISTLALGLTTALLSGVRIAGFEAGVAAVVLLTAFNALIRPLAILLVASTSVLVELAVALAIEVAAVVLVADVVPGVTVDGPKAAVEASIVLAVFTTGLVRALGMDRQGSFSAAVARRYGIRRASQRIADPGVVIVQIDGLAHPILAERLEAGSMPTLASWVRSGSHRLDEWEALLPSMTSAGQAGILYGTNEEIPAFRWYERDRGKVMVSGDPSDANELDRRLSTGSGLLSRGGVSIGNLLTGDAERTYVTTATIRCSGVHLGDSRTFYGFFLDPSALLRTLVLFVGEVLKTRLESVRARRRHLEPRLDGGLRYAGRRALGNVVLREVDVALVVQEMLQATPIIYVDFTDYDEIAHHSGPDRPEAFRALDGIDAAIARVADAAAGAPRPYRMVILSDHGQSMGATFTQRYGASLADVVRAAMAIDDPGFEAPVVLGSGNLGLVYFAGHERRLTIEAIRQLYPAVVPALTSHPGIGLILVRSKADGALAIGPRGVRFLDSGRVDGEDPTTPYGPHVELSLRREDGMRHEPDLLVLSAYDPASGSVAAFEDLIGSHGGLGGAQTRGFILHPVDWSLDEAIPLGAPAVHRNLRRWLASIRLVPAADPMTGPVPTDG